MKRSSGPRGRAATVPASLAAVAVSSFALSLAFVGAAAAQALSPAPAASAASAVAPPNPATLPAVVVTGNPLGSRQTSAPVSVLSGDELVLRRGSTLGETLDREPGVSSTWFGPNANRPVIRGFDGDRVRMLSNSGASFDASSLSFDHAVPIDPLVVERVEVLRGPSALLYGGSAIGGVVNAIDNRIPKYALSGPLGSAEARLGGAARERGGAALVETGSDAFALHADAFSRRTSDLVVPRYVPVEADGSALGQTRRVRNSASATSGGAVGGSWLFGAGYVGISLDDYDSRYGVVAEEGTVIRMKRRHVAAAGEWRDPAGPLRAVRFQLNDTRYRHDEVEDSGAVGTTFRSRGPEARVEVEHAPLGGLKGVVGAQVEKIDFSALGEEAFVPSTQTRRYALFVVEEAKTAFGTLSVGARIERARVDSAGDADPSATTAFGPPQQRSFAPKSVSLGWIAPLSTDWTLSANAASTERAPTSFELYADGVHAATGACERGDPALRVERARTLDVALQWKRGGDSARLGVFAARFPRFVSLEATGAVVDVGGESFPAFVFTPVRARFSGVEAEARKRLVAGAGSGFVADLSGKLDVTRATNLNSGEPLPRIAPLRALVGAEVGRGPWLARLEVEHAARQRRVPATDTETAGYTIVNASLSSRLDVFGKGGLAFVKLGNLGDKLAYSATTVQTIRGLVPLPGRSLQVGLRLAF